MTTIILPANIDIISRIKNQMCQVSLAISGPSLEKNYAILEAPLLDLLKSIRVTTNDSVGFQARVMVSNL